MKEDIESPDCPVLTIVTATWNRRNLLKRLHASLVAQNAPAELFEWLVVDDGSTDGTCHLIQDLAGRSSFPVRLIRQGNGGKHRALNIAFAAVKTKWALVVDSDDWLLANGVANAISEIVSAEEDAQVLAIVAPLDVVGRPAKSYRQTCKLLDYSKWDQEESRVGDSSILLRTHVIRDIPFREFPGERFIAESSVYAQAFREGGIKLSNIRLVCAEYQPEGLSARSLSLRTGSPLGAMFTYEVQLSAGILGVKRWRTKINRYRFFWHAYFRGARPILNKFGNDLVWLLCGFLVFLIDQRKLFKYKK